MSSSRTAYARKGRGLSSMRTLQEPSTMSGQRLERTGTSGAKRHVPRPKVRVALVGALGFGVLVTAAVLGGFGGGNSAAQAVEVAPECIEYAELVHRCFGEKASVATQASSTATGTARPSGRRKSAAQVCSARTAELKKVCS